MKIRHLLTLVLACMVFTTQAQDEHKRVELTHGQKDPVELEFDCCKLFITSNPSRDQDEVNLTIDVENTSSYKLFLFGHAYTEKSLKKHKPSIRFAKSTSKDLIVCTGCRGDEILKIDPSFTRTLNFNRFSDYRLELPIYVVQHKPKKFLSGEKDIINNRKIITLDLDIKGQSASETGDEEFDRLEQAYNDLIEELEGTTFCPRRNHNPRLSVQEAPYKEKIQDLLADISDIKTQHNWRERGEEYKKYKKLKEKLEGIDFKQYEKNCGRCGAGSNPSHHSCNYCNRSLDDVLRTLQRAYQRLDTGRASKSTVIGEINALNKAYNGGCPNLKQRKKSSSKSAQIDSYYNKIANY